ncbi:DUF2063 domain-containing protein [Pelagovum pacificum]|uniref:DUF2063 domain-containing protein n=1 Tax=Pelagovum pacificum TaxID=2588711 RepID=A0A5C5GAA6_9RHOB|nr:DNA-binding domain-containing protein [Pelagovum pacificum]QQA41621.1 putative DNA-binding domain-containing protein [Pelagovum pacificum]TNY30900.1 DUF2063 domain-containing protein [Pelagovum pacificum]
MEQATFTEALLDPARKAPPGLSGPGGHPAVRRFDVYRNNVAVGLTDALRSAFPVVRKLVGDAFFDAMAGEALRRHPPRDPLMMHYGADMPAFLEHFPPAAGLPYLPDVARLELALRRAYHAADAEPVAPDALQAIPAPALGVVRLKLAPSVSVVASRYPVVSIWRANMVAGAPPVRPGAEAALVTRPGFDPQVDPLAPEGLRFVEALRDGLPLEAAADHAGGHIGDTLGLLLSRHAVVEIAT